jgi:formate dehydrogenase (coenzyme F420) beta subunit
MNVADVVDLKRIAKQLLADGEVSVVIGYEAGHRPLTATPLFARTPEEAERLIFDRTCEYNLANYLHQFRGQKVAIVAKGCDERSIVGLIQERQVKREEVVILGAPCDGVIDRRRVARAVGTESFTGASVEEETVVVQACGKERRLALADVIYPEFREDPRFADYLLAEPTGEGMLTELSPRVGELESADSAARWEAFRAEMGKCVLCLACRNVCPACYCGECFADSTNPKWMSKTDDPADAMFFHMTRLHHLAGRCTGCGACVRACPVGVDLRVYNDKLRKDVKNLFDGFEAGMDPETQAPLGCFTFEDVNDIFK